MTCYFQFFKRHRQPSDRWQGGHFRPDNENGSHRLHQELLLKSSDLSGESFREEHNVELKTERMSSIKLVEEKRVRLFRSEDDHKDVDCSSNGTHKS
ncbi:hypothetical protein CEXT_350451 [Caerostris extrusa]|uniref:Uncharacterized protein n=1 Tax=Caerostris extrusa TaxID=172846 RepID=A0AAV4Y159_CAEEX|nr:hypothetical protein CEXT_350451 [Caerostris extrusa]